MGNCVQSGGSLLHGGAGGGGEGCSTSSQQLRRRRRRREEVEAAPPSVVKVKMVLTKGELGLLLARLKAGDRRRLDDVLHEMTTARKTKQRDGWRPSLESIAECPAAGSTTTVD